MTIEKPAVTQSPDPTTATVPPVPPSPPELPVPPVIPPSVETMGFDEKPSARVVVEIEDLETVG